MYAYIYIYKHSDELQYMTNAFFFHYCNDNFGKMCLTVIKINVQLTKNLGLILSNNFELLSF